MEAVNEIISTIINQIKMAREQKKDFDKIMGYVDITESNGLLVWCNNEHNENYYSISVRENFTEEDMLGSIIYGLEYETLTDSYEELSEGIKEVMDNFNSLVLTN